MSWSDTMTSVQVGDDVYGSDGDKVGSVAGVHPSYVVVEKGFFFPTDYYIPLAAITQVTDGQVVLNVSKDTALHSGWETIPDLATSATLSGAGLGAVPGTDVVTGSVADATAWQTGTAGQAPQAGYEATNEDDLVIPLREEEMTATVRETVAGAARIQKRVVAEDRVLDVPVTEEQIRVERRAADAADAGAFEEIVIEVPLATEQVELRKHSRVVEEVVVHKDAVQRTEQVRGTVRHEEVEVIDEGLMANPIDDIDSRV